jgi:23S rRNA (guanosine2251-2'-O)-methyltransferase
MMLYGKNPVIERLKSNPQSIRRIYIQEGHEDTGYIQKKAQKWGLPVCIVPKTKIAKLARNLNTQGVVADIAAFPYAELSDFLEQARKKSHTLVFLDGLNDPQNLGGIIRSLACLGRFSVVLPSHGSVEVTESVLRVACGGENYVPIVKVSNLVQAMKTAKDVGFWLAGSVVKGGEDIRTVKLPFPLGLVLGSEQKGIRDVVRSTVDLCLTLPMTQPRMSLNVAHAAAVFGYEISRQKGEMHDTAA